VLHLAKATGSLEGWLRGEAVIAIQKGKFGAFEDVTAEGGGKRLDLTVTQGGLVKVVEFKVVFNNKNLVGGYNGTGGVAQDIAKLSQLSFDEKYVAVFFLFYSKWRCPYLPKSYLQTSGGVQLQPKEDEDLGDFSKQLSRAVVARLGNLVPAAEEVVEVASNNERWLGFWCHRVP